MSTAFRKIVKDAQKKLKEAETCHNQWFVEPYESFVSKESDRDKKKQSLTKLGEYEKRFKEYHKEQETILLNLENECNEIKSLTRNLKKFKKENSTLENDLEKMRKENEDLKEKNSKLEEGKNDKMEPSSPTVKVLLKKIKSVIQTEDK